MEHPNNWSNPNAYVRVGCVLQLSGKNFDPDTFLSNAQIPNDCILLKGPLGFPEEGAKEKIENFDLETLPVEIRASIPDIRQMWLNLLERQNLGVLLSDAPNLSEQVDHAIRFLKNHAEALRSIKDSDFIEHSVVSFTAKSKQDADSFRDFPADFYELIDEIGIGGATIGSIGDRS